MSDTSFDVVGIGNAIVDVIGRCDDAFLARHDAPKGHMRLVDAATVRRIYDDMGPAIEISGGSAANTIAGIASLGGKTAYIGKVADDEFGRIFAHDLKAAGVAYATEPKAGGEPTARSIILVTTDGERTMNTFLGVSPELDSSDIDEAVISSGRILYLEGYLFDRPQAQQAFQRAAAIARTAGRKVALTLSDGFCVDRHRAAFLELARDRVDILFANESELTGLMQTSDFDTAVREASKLVPMLAATRSAKGSLLVTPDETVSVPARQVRDVVDTTGAGDLYAAGVLYGLSRGADLSTCGALGSLCASEVISHIGARPEVSLAELARFAGVSI